MLNPVSPREFYQHESGLQFMRAAVAHPDDKFSMFNGWGSRGLQTVRVALSDTQVRERMEVCADWITGNYDPDTNTHTLYRGINDRMLVDFEDHGAVTSRAVRIFGNYDMRCAEETLRKAARGKVQRHLRFAVEEALEESLAGPSKYDVSSRLKETQDLLRGKPTTLTSDRLLEKAEVFHAVRAGGKGAYLTSVKEANRDYTPPDVGGSILGLLHSSVHLTTDPEFIRSRQSKNWFSHVLKVTFVPGSAPIAPDIGFADNQLILPPNGPNLLEREWCGVGQISPKIGLVTIEVDHSLSVKAEPYDPKEDL